MDMKRVYLAFCIVLTLLCIIPATGVGCNWSAEYERLVVHNGIGYYSFEYQTKYDEPRVEPYGYWGSSAVYLSCRHEEAKRANISISIYVYRSNDELPDADSMLEIRIENIGAGSTLLDCSQIMVSDIQGNQIIYSYNVNNDTDEGTPITEVAYEVFFDYQETIYWIKMHSDEDIREDAEADLKHILDTLEFFERGSCTEYETFTYEEDIANFSFQYPACWENDRNYHTSYTEEKYPNVSFTRYSPDEGWASWFSVYLHTPGSVGRHIPDWGYSVDPSIAIAADITELGISYDDFQLLEQSSVTVAGIPAEQIVCSFTRDYFDWLSEGMHSDDIAIVTPLVSRMVYFTYDGLIWKIWITSIEQAEETDEAAFEHLLETFRILE